MYLSLPVSLLAFSGCIGLFILARWRSGQPVRPERGPRMIPWTLIAIVAGACGLILAVHLLSFAGIEPVRRTYP